MFINICINNTIKYNIIKQNLYNETNPTNKIRYKFVPIQYKNINLLVTTLNDLEGLFAEKNIDKIEITPPLIVSLPVFLSAPGTKKTIAFFISLENSLLNSFS